MSEIALYNYFRSSTSHRVRISLHWKGIPFEYRPVHLLNNGGEQHQPAYRQLNPAGEVPTLIHNGHTIAQSMAVLEYLEEVFPEKSLLPKDPVIRAQIRQFCENINCAHSLQNLKVQQYIEKSFGLPEAKKQMWLDEWMGRLLHATEKLLEKHSGTYCFGNEVTLADLFLIPQCVSAVRFKIDLSPYTRISKIYETCEALEAFKKAHPFNQVDTPSELRR